MTAWVEQEDWSTLRAGDRVRVANDDGMLTGTLGYTHGDAHGDIFAIAIDVSALDDRISIRVSAWSLFVPAKPAVVLPTEPGWYLGTGGGTWELREEDRSYVQRWIMDGSHMLDIEAEGNAPFTKLEPVAVTAKKVLAALGEIGLLNVGGRDEPHWVVYCEGWDSVAGQFGVTYE